MGEQNPAAIVEQLKQVLLGIFSWIVLTAVGIILSGKLLAQCLPLRIQGNDLFAINLIMFRIRASGDEVTLGFINFGVMLGSVVVFGGYQSYEFFKQHTGLDVGQWNSLCAIASFFSIIFAVALRVAIRPSQVGPIISGEERRAQLESLDEAVSHGSGGAESDG